MGTPVKSLFLFVLFFFSALVQAGAPQRVNATYSFYKSGQEVGVVTETFTRTGNRYEILSETKAIGVFALFAKGNIKLISRGEITKDGLRPSHFEHHRGSSPDKLIIADFDWKAQTLTMKYDGKTETAALVPGTQDRISRMYQFMYEPPKGKALNFSMTNGRNIDQYQYVLTDQEQLKTPAGSFKTSHFVQQHKSDEDGAEMWLANTMRYLPVLIIIKEKDGGNLEQQLTKLTIK